MIHVQPMLGNIRPIILFPDMPTFDSSTSSGSQDGIRDKSNWKHLWKKQIELVPYRATKISRKTQKHLFFPLIAKLVCFLYATKGNGAKMQEKKWLELKTSPS